LIVLNSLRDDGAGLVNQPTKLLLSIKNIEPMELKSKRVADDILNKVIANFYE
jgi:hypothetical protein